MIDAHQAVSFRRFNWYDWTWICQLTVTDQRMNQSNSTMLQSFSRNIHLRLPTESGMFSDLNRSQNCPANDSAESELEQIITSTKREEIQKLIRTERARIIEGQQA